MIHKFHFANVAGSLIASSGLAVGLGYLFTLLATRSNSLGHVGLGTTEISAMVFLAGASQLNYGYVVLRYAPSAYERLAKLVGYGYLIIFVLGTLSGTAFVLSGFGSHYIGTAFTGKLLFAASVPFWAIFVYQDAVLIVLGRARTTVVENATFALVKLGLLFVPDSLIHGTSRIYVAWTLPVFPIVIVISVIVIRAIRVGGTSRAEPHLFPNLKTLCKSLSTEFVLMLGSNTLSLVVPLLILSRLGPVDAGLFYIPWVVQGGAWVMLYGLATGYSTERLNVPSRAKETLSNYFKSSFALMLLLAIVMVFLAPDILSIFGARYRGATDLLRIMSIGFIFTPVTFFASTNLRLEQSFGKLALLWGAHGIILLLATIALIGPAKLNAFGIAYAVTESAFALILLPYSVARARAQWHKAT